MVSVLNRVRMFEHQSNDGTSQNRDVETPSRSRSSGQERASGVVPSSPRSPRSSNRRDNGRSFGTSSSPANARSPSPGWRNKATSRAESPDTIPSPSRSVAGHEKTPRYSSPFLPVQSHTTSTSLRPSPVILPQKPLTPTSAKNRSASPSFLNRGRSTAASPDRARSPRQQSSSPSNRIQRQGPVILPQKPSNVTTRTMSPSTRWRDKDGAASPIPPVILPQKSNIAPASRTRSPSPWKKRDGANSPVPPVMLPQKLTGSRPPSPRWQSKDRDGAASPVPLPPSPKLTPNRERFSSRSSSPVTHPQSPKTGNNMDKFPAGKQERKRWSTPSYPPQPMPGSAPNASLTVITSQRSSSPVAIKARSSSPSWMLRDNGRDSPDTIPAPDRTPTNKEIKQSYSSPSNIDKKYASPFLPLETPSTPTSQRPSPVVLPSKNINKKVPFKHIQNQDSFSSAGPSTTDNIHARAKQWQSPKAHDQGPENFTKAKTWKPSGKNDHKTGELQNNTWNKHKGKDSPIAILPTKNKSKQVEWPPVSQKEKNTNRSASPYNSDENHAPPQQQGWSGSPVVILPMKNKTKQADWPPVSQQDRNAQEEDHSVQNITQNVSDGKDSISSENSEDSRPPSSQQGWSGSPVVILPMRTKSKQPDGTKALEDDKDQGVVENPHSNTSAGHINSQSSESLDWKHEESRPQKERLVSSVVILPMKNTIKQVTESPPKSQEEDTSQNHLSLSFSDESPESFSQQDSLSYGDTTCSKEATSSRSGSPADVETFQDEDADSDWKENASPFHAVTSKERSTGELSRMSSPEPAAPDDSNKQPNTGNRRSQNTAKDSMRLAPTGTTTFSKENPSTPSEEPSQSQAAEGKSTPSVADDPASLKKSRASRLVRARETTRKTEALESSLTDASSNKTEQPSRLTRLKEVASYQASLDSAQGSKDESEASSSGTSSTDKELGEIADRASKMEKDSGNEPVKLTSKPTEDPAKPTSKPAVLPSLKAMRASRAAAQAKQKAIEQSKAAENAKAESKNSRAEKIAQARKRAAAHDALRSIQDKDDATTTNLDTSTEQATTADHKNDQMDEVRESSDENTGKKQPVRRGRAVSKVSHQEARRALLISAQRQKEKAKGEKVEKKSVTNPDEKTGQDVETVQKQSTPPQTEQTETNNDKKEANQVAVRLGYKASRVLAMKNLSKPSQKTDGKSSPSPPAEDYEISANPSIVSALSSDSIRSKRTNHPAFVARSASPRPGTQTEKSHDGVKNMKSKPFSEELFSSFRHFNAARLSAPEADMNNTPGYSFDNGRSTPNTVELTTSYSGNQSFAVQDHSDPAGYPGAAPGRPPQYVSNSQVCASNSQVEVHVTLTSDDEKREEASFLDSRTFDSESKSFAPPPISESLSMTIRESVARDNGLSVPGRQDRRDPDEGTVNRPDRRDPDEGSAHAGRKRGGPSPTFPDEGSVGADSSPFLEQEDSLHSTSERNYMMDFYDMGRSRFMPKQSFQEVSYLSSLSSNTFSNQSTMSFDDKRGGLRTPAKPTGYYTSPMAFNQPQHHFAFRAEPSEGTGLLGPEIPSTMSPGPSMRSMRSGHSLAHSIISISPRGGENPRENSEFDYLKPSPSKRGRLDADPIETLREMDEEEKSKVSDASGKVSNEAADEKSSASDKTAKQNGGAEPPAYFSTEFPAAKGSVFVTEKSNKSVLDVVTSKSDEKENKPSLEPPEGIQKSMSYKQRILPALSSTQSNSGSPPGFRLGDHKIHKIEEKASPDPDGATPDPFMIPEDLFGDCESSDSDEDDRSLGTELKQGDLKADTTMNFDKDMKNGKDKNGAQSPNVVAENIDPEVCKDRSVSTKETSRTISTSLRSGLSSIQNAAVLTTSFVEDVLAGSAMSPANGSTSMRTGLSSIQVAASSIPEEDDINASSSTRNGLAEKMNVRISEIDVSNPTDVSVVDTDIESQKSMSQHQSLHMSLRSTKFPDTIPEEEEESSGMKKSKSDISSQKSDAESVGKDGEADALSRKSEKGVEEGSAMKGKQESLAKKENQASLGKTADNRKENQASSGKTKTAADNKSTISKEGQTSSGKSVDNKSAIFTNNSKDTAQKTASTASTEPDTSRSEHHNDANPTSKSPGLTNEAMKDDDDTPFDETGSEQSKRQFLPPILVQDDNGAEPSILDASNISSPGSSKHSSKWWKKGKVGMKMPNVIKQVLSKASPRHGIGPSPMNRQQARQEDFSSDEDDDDIFGGLEEDNTMEDAKKKLSAAPNEDVKKKPVTPKTPKVRPQQTRKMEMKGEQRSTEKPMVAPKKSTRVGNQVEKPAVTKKTPRTPVEDGNNGKTRANFDVIKPRPINKDVNNKSRPNKDVIEKAAAKLKKFKPQQPPRPVSPPQNPNSVYSNDRSGTVLDESEVLEGVNSDITSSLLAGNGPAGGPKSALRKKKQPLPKLKVDVEATEKANFKGKDSSRLLLRLKTPKTPTKTPETAKAATSGSVSFRTKSSKGMSNTTTKTEEQDAAPKTPRSNKTRDEESNKPEVKIDDEGSAILSAGESEAAEEESPKATSGSIFMNLGCGFVDTWTTNISNTCHFGSKVNLSEDVIGEDELGVSRSDSTANSQSQLTDLEKRIWNDWDRLDASIKGNNNQTDEAEATAEKKEEQEKKRQAARGKLLEIAGSAMSSQMSLTKEDDDERGASSDDYTDDSSESTESGDSSGVSGESGMTSTTSTTNDGNAGESQSYYSGATESDFASDSPSSRKEPNKPNASTPILLSFSQKSLVEKFTKQLATDGVEVLKLNTRKQWQTRYFTVSKEQIALTAHEGNNRKDVAHCPNALLWLKKFNPKNGGYGISNIDKNGHGGMMLVDLVDVHASTKTDLENPIPKKLMDKFKEPVLLTLDYVMDGGKENRSIEFCCKDNDEAQFLCTCMRVIRDLLKREQSLRMKKSSHER